MMARSLLVFFYLQYTAGNDFAYLTNKAIIMGESSGKYPSYIFDEFISNSYSSARVKIISRIIIMKHK